MEGLKNKQTWWFLLLVSGLVLIAVGIWVLLSPAEAYYSLSIVLSIGLFISGVFNLFLLWSLIGKLRGWGWLFTAALIDVALAVYLFYFPMLTMILLPMLLGVLLLFKGFVAIGRSLQVSGAHKTHWFSLLIPGLIVIFCSMIILDNPLIGMINIVSWLGIVLIVSGLLRIFFLFKIMILSKGIKHIL